MIAFSCVAIPEEVAERFRSTKFDDNGNVLRRSQAEEGSNMPCRVCLEFALPGEVMLLGSYNLPRPLGIYWTPSPIFIHERACSRFQANDVVAPIIAKGVLVSVRAYDASDQCLYDLGQVCAGSDVDGPLEKALSDARTAFAQHSHGETGLHTVAGRNALHRRMRFF